MGYYNYHAIATNLIKTGHCTHIEINEKPNKNSHIATLFFNNHMPMPIKDFALEKYLSLLSFYKIPIISIIDKN